MVKKELLDIAALVRPRFLRYRVDTAAERARCIVLGLTPYNCEFNPIKLIWAQIKNGVAVRNGTFNLADVETLLKEETAKVTAEGWGSTVRHVVGAESKFKQDSATGGHIQPMVIRLNENDTASESDFSGIEPLD